MAWVVFDSETGNVLCVDLSASAPVGCARINMPEVVGWPMSTDPLATLRVVDGALKWVNAVGMDAAWQTVRDQRDRLLDDCDWIVVRSMEQGVAVPPEWSAYRQALRDITDQPDPFGVVWPTEPENIE